MGLFVMGVPVSMKIGAVGELRAIFLQAFVLCDVLFLA
jgi:hypothetical protein